MTPKNVRLALATLAKELQCSPTDLIEAEGYPSPLVEAPAIAVA